jgi:hypothetical protein
VRRPSPPPERYIGSGSAPFAAAPGKKVAEDGLPIADQGRFRRTIGRICEQPQDIAAQASCRRRGRRVECSPTHPVDLDAVHLDDRADDRQCVWFERHAVSPCCALSEPADACVMQDGAEVAPDRAERRAVL